MGRGNKGKRGKGKRSKAKRGSAESVTVSDESTSETQSYPVPELNHLLRSTMPTLDDFPNILTCRYCNKDLTRGLATPRKNRPEVEHIIEVQAFIQVMKEIYCPGSTLEESQSVDMSVRRMNDWIGFVNGETNLIIACGECNMKKKVLQQEAIRHANQDNLQDRSAYQPRNQEPQWIALADKDKIEDMVTRALIGVAVSADRVKLPMVHVRRLAVVTLSHWMCEYDNRYFVLWAEDFLSRGCLGI